MRHTVLDLFAGCGGLSLGFESVGFKSMGIEINKQCCDTYNANLQGVCVDKNITSDMDFPKADVVIGGPPCQPFSVFGHQKGNRDARNGFPAFISAVKKTMPAVWMFENVKGMLYRNKAYFELSIKKLQRLGYAVNYKVLNAVDYGVPQNRLRIIAVGHNSDFEFPTISSSQVTSGDALGDMAYRYDGDSKFLTASMDKYIAVYEKKSQMVTPRDLHLNKPARTLTCRNIAGATSDMHRIKLPNGKRRRLSIREAARLQSFPDWFSFAGTENEQFNQIGNAVPPLFAQALARQIKKCL